MQALRAQVFELAGQGRLGVQDLGPMRLMPKAANSICAARRPKMPMNIRRNFSLGTFMRMRAPSTAPMTEPNAMGAATGVTISPRAKYPAALAAAVTPIMKLEVAEETLMGSRSAVSMAGILSTPLPMPSRAEISPAPYISVIPNGRRRTDDASCGSLRRASICCAESNRIMAKSRYKYCVETNPAKNTPHSAPEVVAVSSKIANRMLVSRSFRKGAALAHEQAITETRLAPIAV